MDPHAPTLTHVAALPFQYPVTHFRTYDGDTIMDCLLDKGHRQSSTLNVRLSNIDTPELRGKSDLHEEAGRAATAVARRWLSDAREASPYNLRMVSMEADARYGRIEGDFIGADMPSESLCGYLLRHKLALPSDRGGRPVWTDAQLRLVIHNANQMLQAPHPRRK